jgi:hypothetical protein
MARTIHSLNVSLDRNERLAVERLTERLRAQDPVKYRTMRDVVADAIRERMAREFGPAWETELAPPVEVAAA